MDRTGQILLGKYELTRMIGKGGMGEVWEGEHQLTGRRVAVKVLSENYLQNRKVVARFGREARAASSVNHEGIVEILDQDKDDQGVPFLVMEFLEGESVGERIKKRRKLPQDDALAIMLPLLDALDAAHQAGIIHRDLKPDNVFILPGARGEERIKILDFGISQKADEIEHHLTQEGSVLGTPHYMSPEQARGEPGIDARADLYAAAVLFFECVVGDVPFDAGNYNALLQIILGSPPPSPRSRGAELSGAVEQVLLAAMDKDRQRRPPSARQFHALLLEAGMQDDDALLDIETWSFTTASEPPPPVEFGPGDDMGLEPPAEEDSAAWREPLAESPASGVRRSPLSDRPLAPPSTRPLALPRVEEFGVGAVAAAPRSAVASAGGVPGVARHEPRPAPGQAGTSFELRTAEPARGYSLGSAAAPGRSAGVDPAPRRKSLRPERPERPERPRIQLTSPAEPPDRTWLRTLASWTAMIAAIAVLGYLASIVFSRPDPRKNRGSAAHKAASAQTE